MKHAAGPLTPAALLKERRLKACLALVRERGSMSRSELVMELAVDGDPISENTAHDYMKILAESGLVLIEKKPVRSRFSKFQWKYSANGRSDVVASTVNP